MKKLLLLIGCLFFTTEIGLAQPTKENVPVIINEIPADKKDKSPTKISDLEGLAGKAAPVFKTVDMNGKEYNLEAMRGNVVVVNLWGTFCEPCVQEIPKLNSLVEKYKDKTVIFLAPAVDGKEVLNGFLQKYPFSYQVLPASFGIIAQYSPKKKAASAQNGNSFDMILPTHLIIDKDGIVVKHFWGFSKTTDADISAAIDELLAAKTQ